MKHILIFILLSFATTLSAQNKFYADYVKYVDGEKVIYCSGNNIKLCISFQEKIAKHHELRVVVLNESDQSVTFDPTEITAMYIKKGKAKECGVYSFEEYLKKEKTNVLLWGPNNVEHVTVSGKSETKDSYGNVVSSSNNNVTTSVYTGAMDAAMEEVVERAKSTYLKKNTLLPNDQIHGLVVVKNPKADNLILTIPINGQSYIFDLSTE